MPQELQPTRFDTVHINRRQTRRIVGLLHLARTNKELLFNQEGPPPETAFVNLVTAYSKEKNDPKFQSNALFLVCSLVYGEKTSAFFSRISDPKQFAKFAWLFDPNKVCRRNPEDILTACDQYFRSGGYTRSALEQWVHNCQVIKSDYSGDIRNFFTKQDNDAVKIVAALEGPPGKHGKDKQGIRRYGPKLARLASAWQVKYLKYELSNLDYVGPHIDFQIARILIQTGCLVLDSPTQSRHVTSIARELLTTLCIRNHWDSYFVVETLWHLGVHGCSLGNHSDCPVASMCDRLISATTYYKDGLFNPADTGRWSNPRSPTPKP